MNKYKFRAETILDVFNLVNQLVSEGKQIKLINPELDPDFPDFYIEIHSNLSIEDIRDSMGRTDDGSVMYQSLKTLANYDGERDRNINYNEKGVRIWD